MQRHDAEGGTIIVLEPATGAIRAMANWPVFDPNHYTEYPIEVYSRNPAVSSLYEPGSTFKIITAAAGLQSRSFTADTLVNDIGIIDRAGMRIHNWNHAGNGMITVGDMLYYSSNVGAVLLNELMGPETFYAFLEDFGFGVSTGVDVSAEEQGIVHGPASPAFNAAIFVSNSYGQGVAVTPLQLVRAVAAIANDGVLMKPYVVAERCQSQPSLPEPDGQQTADISYEYEENEIGRAEVSFDGADEGNQGPEQGCVTTMPTTIRQVIEPGVAWTIRRMLVNAANHYAPVIWGPKTGNWADQWLVPGYEVGAKTGTASIPLPGGGYDPRYVIGSVVGFAPAETTRYAVLVKIDRPEGDAWGLDAAIPAFYEVVSQLMRYERLEPDPALVSAGQSFDHQ
ncbi:MAG: penicillin-binding protein 2 [Chloroflexaceae bacterium]|nr:penicillin-binding protein 2 [Chloroflexaceae bacterium]